MLPINVNRPLKSVTDRVQSCDAVKTAIDSWGDRLAALLSESFDPLLAEGQVTPFATQLAVFRTKLVEEIDLVVTTDRAYRDQRAQEAVSRGRRDLVFDDVTADVIELRKAFTGFYSDDKLGELGFARRVPDRPVVLLEHATHLAARLSDPDLDLTGSRYEGQQLDSPSLVRQLVTSVAALKQATEELNQEVRDTEALKLAKDEALTQYNTSFLWIARAVESFCRLVGLDEVARRVRPSQRRPGVTARRAQGSDEGPANGQSPADSSPDGGTEGEGSSESTPESADPNAAN